MISSSGFLLLAESHNRPAKPLRRPTVFRRRRTGVLAARPHMGQRRASNAPIETPESCRAFAIAFNAGTLSAVVFLLVLIVTTSGEPPWDVHTCELLQPVTIKEHSRHSAYFNVSKGSHRTAYFAWVPVRTDDGRVLLAHRAPNGKATHDQELVDEFIDKTDRAPACRGSDLSSTRRCTRCLTNPAFDRASDLETCRSIDWELGPGIDANARCLNRVFLGTRSELNGYLIGNLATYYPLLFFLLLFLMPIGACCALCAFPDVFQPMIDRLTEGRPGEAQGGDEEAQRDPSKTLH